MLVIALGMKKVFRIIYIFHLALLVNDALYSFIMNRGPTYFNLDVNFNYFVITLYFNSYFPIIVLVSLRICIFCLEAIFTFNKTAFFITSC